MIAPSILNADFLNLGREIEMLNRSKADWIHLDVMDGVFVPNISFGIPVIEAVNTISKKMLDAHLMIVHPEKYIDAFKKAGAGLINVHYETCEDNLPAVLEKIKNAGCKAAFTIKPDTPVETILEYAGFADMILVMSVFPGFGGQKFIEETYGRIKKLKRYITDHNLDTLIQVDGGIYDENAEAVYAAGADVLVVGSFIFRAANPEEAIHSIRSLAKPVSH